MHFHSFTILDYWITPQEYNFNSPKIQFAETCIGHSGLFTTINTQPTLKICVTLLAKSPWPYFISVVLESLCLSALHTFKNTPMGHRPFDFTIYNPLWIHDRFWIANIKAVALFPIDMLLHLDWQNLHDMINQWS